MVNWISYSDWPISAKLDKTIGLLGSVPTSNGEEIVGVGVVVVDGESLFVGEGESLTTNDVVGVIVEVLLVVLESELEEVDELVGEFDWEIEEVIVEDLEIEDVLEGDGEEDELVDGSLEELLVGEIVSDDDKDLEREIELVSEIEGVTLGESDGLILWKSTITLPPFPDMDDELCWPHVPSILCDDPLSLHPN